MHIHVHASQKFMPISTSNDSTSFSGRHCATSCNVSGLFCWNHVCLVTLHLNHLGHATSLCKLTVHCDFVLSYSPEQRRLTLCHCIGRCRYMYVILFRSWQRIGSHCMLLGLHFIYSVVLLILLQNIYSFRILFLLVLLVIVPLFLVLFWNIRWSRQKTKHEGKNRQ